VVTAPATVIKSLAAPVLTDKGLQQFARDRAATAQSIL
jgi:transaldolase